LGNFIEFKGIHLAGKTGIESTYSYFDQRAGECSSRWLWRLHGLFLSKNKTWI